MDLDLKGKSVLVTGGNRGIGLGIALGFAEEGANEEAVAKTVERFGALHIAHLNAGIAKASTVIDGDIAVFDQVVAVNLRGVYLGMRAIAPAMISAGGGSLIATASVAGLRGGPGMPSYYASKHGVVGLVKAAAIEFAPHKIRVNAILPGWTITEMAAVGYQNEKFRNITTGRTPVRRWAEPAEFEEVGAYLCDPSLTFHTGDSLTVDGGYTIF